MKIPSENHSVLSLQDSLMTLVEAVFILKMIFFLYRHWILKNTVPSFPTLLESLEVHTQHKINIENREKS